MNDYRENDSNAIFKPSLGFIALCFLIGFAGFGYVLVTLPGLPDKPNPAAIEGGWKFALVATHVLTFVLIPLAMKVFYESLKRLNLQSGIFASQLGLSFIMVAIASEIGWHVTQDWFYQNQFTMLNFMFYFFLISAFALWADAFVMEDNLGTRLINILFAISLLAISILYPLGYENDENSAYKIPIYIALTLVFSVLTYRGYKILEDWKIILFPIFSVGINLTFIFLLDKYGVPQDGVLPDPLYLNPLFHILHDLGGTEAGVAIFTWLVYSKGKKMQNTTESTTIGSGQLASGR